MQGQIAKYGSRGRGGLRNMQTLMSAWDAARMGESVEVIFGAISATCNIKRSRRKIRNEAINFLLHR